MPADGEQSHELIHGERVEHDPTTGSPSNRIRVFARLEAQLKRGGQE